MTVGVDGEEVVATPAGLQPDAKAIRHNKGRIPTRLRLVSLVRFCTSSSTFLDVNPKRLRGRIAEGPEWGHGM